MKIDNALSRRDFLKISGGVGLMTGLEALGISSIALAPEAATPEKSPFTEQPDFEVDFSKMENGPLPKGLFRIQSEIDYDWNPIWNNEKQMYTDNLNNVRVEDGKLILEAHKETANGQEYTSGKIDTKGIWDFEYGKVEIVAKFPAGVGTFPALWFLPADQVNLNGGTITTDQNDPNYWQQDGEIDMAEMIGVNPETLYTTMHTYDTLTSGSEANATSISAPDLSSEFHTYGIKKTPEKIVFTLDGDAYYTKEKISDDPAEWPFDQDWYLLINFAVGGYWSDGVVQAKGLDFPDGVDPDTVDGATLEVKSIMHYPLAG
ncbi:MAG: family 16 glycosylhydrolase [Candidatus Woesebacteria bacterium]